jgi:transcriptional regulator with XRE-family HTH domain
MPNFLASNLRHLRLKAGKTQSQLGFSLNKAHTSIGNWEKGISEPSLSEIEQIARIFEIEPAVLLFTDLSNVQNEKASKNAKNGKSVQDGVQNSVQNEPQFSNIMLSSTPVGPGIHQGMPAVVTVDSAGRENVVFVPVKAQAGYLLGYGDVEYIGTLPAYALPGLHGATHRAFEVAGLSMFHTLHDHDIVVAKWATSADFRDDRVFVVVTKTEGILVKRCLFRDGKIICKSDNNHRGEYPPIVVELSDVAEIWYVVQRWTRQLAPPGELYRRVVELEAKMALLEHRLNQP